VTGSGKTEVYMQAMAQVLKQGRQCLVLVPEIGLTPQTISRFEKRFKCPVVNLHSGLSDTERLQAWRQAHAGTAGIVIGTRSAVFTSLARPGLIVIDEEHDASFKQQDGFRYSARDLAVVRAREEGIGIVLGSATPSLESLYNADRGRYQHLLMPQRSGSAATAPMRLVDIENQPLEAGFSETALLAMDKHLQAGNQVLVFINRRGYAPVLHCQQCGWTAECDNCVAQLTVHAQPPGLHCHHCGKQKSLPRACPNCASRQLDTMGLGTQQIESRLRERFTTVPVLRIDRDSTRSRKKLKAMLDQVNSGEPCLLLGTQMLAKGHHFPGITLVVVVDADSGLFSADFRGQELMAQTVTQVAGRAGRSDQAGEVLIQSRHCGHQTLQSLIQLSYADFSRQLLAERKLTAMPPFAWLALLRCEARSAETGLQFLQQIALQQQQLCQQFGLQVDCLGPLPAPMEKRAGRFRSQLSFKSEQRAQLHELLARLLPAIEAMKLPAGMRWSLDIDPVDMI
jgi:primosomal protein N' (replication factor Y)